MDYREEKYKLALRLKDAGFPQHPNDYDAHADCWTDVCNPSLSELIEECGDNFMALEKLDNIWLALYKGKKINLNNLEDIPQGKTPEEAVAKLWLGLKKNEI